MDEKLRQAIEIFILGRINDLGMDAPEDLTEALTNVTRCLERLEGALTPEQLPLLRALENALNEQVGEETLYYYKSGFYDAIQFLLDRDRDG